MRVKRTNPLTFLTMFTVLIVIFILGYAAIAFEKSIGIDKAASALITGVTCWIVLAINAGDQHLVSESLTEHLGEISGILFFLLGAMTIVELIDAHNGFDLVANLIRTTNKRKLLWLVCIIAFFLSSVLDNLTTTIVMVALVRKLIPEKNERLWFAGMIIIAANAGGAWSPIGDVTTTMLWIGGQVTAGPIIVKLFIPSLVNLLVPLTILSFRMNGKIILPPDQDTMKNYSKPGTNNSIVFFCGVGILILVPVFKMLTGLPPYMGVLLGLGLLWVITEILHSNSQGVIKEELSVSRALRRIDTPSILFFLGILISIGALQSGGLLSSFSKQLDDWIGNSDSIAISLGVLSSIVDNVPLVAAAQGMYSIEQFPADHSFWQLLALTTGTGGSALIIGSAAGVAAMGMEKIGFFWYLKRITLLALAGYAAGVGVYMLMHSF